MSGGPEEAARRVSEIKKHEWVELKQQGSSHYKSGSTEPVDLYKAGGLFNHFARCNIIKYAFRMKGVEDCKKIIHYAQLLMVNIQEDCQGK